MRPGVLRKIGREEVVEERREAAPARGSAGARAGSEPPPPSSFCCGSNAPAMSPSNLHLGDAAGGAARVAAGGLDEGAGAALKSRGALAGAARPRASSSSPMASVFGGALRQGVGADDLAQRDRLQVEEFVGERLHALRAG